MPGQGTIVATGSIAYPPGLEGVDPQRLYDLGVSKVMTMTSTYDHRVIQGAESGAFLKRVDELLRGADDFYGKVFAALGIEPPRVEGSPNGSSQLGHLGQPGARHLHTRGLGRGGRGAAPGRAGGHLDRQGPPDAGPPGRPAGPAGVRAPRRPRAADPASVDLTPELMERIPASVLRMAVPGKSFADALPHLTETYCGTIAYEIEHIAGPNRRVWLRRAIESGDYRVEPGTEERRSLLQPPVRGRGAGEVPAQGVPGQEAVLDRGPGRAGAHAGRDDRADQPGGRP